MVTNKCIQLLDDALIILFNNDQVPSVEELAAAVLLGVLAGILLRQLYKNWEKKKQQQYDEWISKKMDLELERLAQLEKDNKQAHQKAKRKIKLVLK